MNEKNPSQGKPALGDLYKSREQVPTKPIEQEWIQSETSMLVPGLSEGGYGRDGNMLIRLRESGAVEVTAYTDQETSKLVAEGYSEQATGLPLYVGDPGGRTAKDLQRKIATNLAAIDRGLRSHDYDAMSDEQRAELEGLDIGYSGQLFGSRGALEVSNAHDIDPYTEEGQARLGQLGSFAKVKVPFPTNPDRGYEAFAVTDQYGNQYLAPSCEALEDYLSACDFAEAEEPFDYDMDAVRQRNPNALEMAQAVSSRSQEYHDSEGNRQRLKTNIVDMDN